MTNKDHKDILLSKTNEFINSIDNLLLHPKNKILLYQRYVLSKISWHLAVADLPVTWVKETLDNIGSKLILSWLEIPTTGTLNIIRQSKNKLGLSVILISDRFTQCQVTLRNKLKNLAIKILLKFTTLQKERKLHMISTNPPERQ